MNIINLDNGLAEVTINNDPQRVVRWNPTDPDFVKRFDELLKYIDSLNDRIQKFVTELEKLPRLLQGKLSPDDGEKVLEELSGLAGLNKEVSEMIDKTFDAPVCEVAFRGANPLTPAKDGGLLISNFITNVNRLSPAINN